MTLLCDPTVSVCQRIGELYRTFRTTQEQRKKIENSTLAQVAIDLGYRSGLDEDERAAIFDEAATLIDSVRSGRVKGGSTAELINITDQSLDQFKTREKRHKASLMKIARELPVAAWATADDQHGFGLFALAKIVGETGHLTAIPGDPEAEPGTPEHRGNFATISRLWKRMGCSPHEFRGKTLMGSTWRIQDSKKRKGEFTLPPGEWTEYGYSGRRRSVMYEITKRVLMAQRDEGPYRDEYLRVKVAAFHKHPEWGWSDCTKCGDKGKRERLRCRTCGGTGKKSGHGHNHACLLVAKHLLRNLWCAWNPTKVLDEATLARRREASAPSKPARKRRKAESAAAARARHQRGDVLAETDLCDAPL